MSSFQQNNNGYNNNINNTNETLLSNSKSIYQIPTNSNIFLPLPIKPRFIKNFNEVIINCNQLIFNYLTLKEVTLLRRVNKLFLNLVNDYYEIRLKIEIADITNFQNQNEENTILYMQNIDSQIPLSNNQWLEFDLKSVTKNMELLDKSTIIQLKSIKKLFKFNENIYAPFCIILGYKSSNYKVKANGWKKTADLILNDPNLPQKIQQLDYENFSDNDILKAFLYLNSEDLSLSRIKRYSLPFAKLIKWCQSVVSYHILIHPYTFRNKTSQIEVGSEVHKYVLFMDKIISKFYKFKRFLFRLGLVQIPLGDYVFNLQHNRVKPKEKTDLSKIINIDMIANILSYLPLEQSYKFINVNHFGVNCFKQNLNINCYKIIKEIILFKLQSYEKLYPIIPILYENNIFGKYFLMLDDILNSTVDVNQYGINFISFLSKDHLNEIRNLKSNNQYINIICKIFCVLFNVKVEKKANQRGEIIPLYIKAVKLLAIKGVLPKLMRYFNKLELNKKQLQILMSEIINLYGKNKIQEIKKINKGIYQILIWELCLFEYLKEFNPFMFINIDIFQKQFENNNPEDVQIINYYLEMINYLKYNLKFKYHFQSLVFTNMPEVPCYEFIPMITNLLQELNNEKINISPLLDNSNVDKVKTANIYFDNKDYIPIHAKPALYERIMEEIFNVNEKLYLNTLSNENLLNKSTYNIYSNNKININANLSESNNNSNININNLGIIREENTPLENIGDNKMLNKYLRNKNSNSNINNFNLNNNINSNNMNGISEFENGGEQNIYNNMENQINNNTNSIDLISSINIQNKFKNKNILQNINYTNFNDIPDNIIIKNILLYLDIKSVSPFSLVNKKCNTCYKINMFLRLLILDNHKQIFENENEDYIQSIDTKRNTFFADYELPPPNKEHAIELISQLTNKDLIEIKNIFRKYNKHNEILIAPFVHLLGGKPQKKYNINGQKMMNYFNIAQKLLNDRKIYKKIIEFNLETITNNVFKETEKLLKNEAFSFNKIKGYSPCLYHLICWEMGVLEYHRAIRYFCLNYYDYKILSKEEIVFCGQMDNINIMFNKLKYYNYKFCKNYENDAINIMNELNSGMGVINEDNNENEEMAQNENKINENQINEEQNNVNENDSKIINNNNNDERINCDDMNGNHIENKDMEEKIIEEDYNNNNNNKFQDSIELNNNKNNNNEENFNEYDKEDNKNKTDKLNNNNYDYNENDNKSYEKKNGSGLRDETPMENGNKINEKYLNNPEENEEEKNNNNTPNINEGEDEENDNKDYYDNISQKKSVSVNNDINNNENIINNEIDIGNTYKDNNYEDNKNIDIINNKININENNQNNDNTKENLKENNNNDELDEIIDVENLG